MSANDLDIVKSYFQKAGVPLSRDDTWTVQGTPVVKHKALERLAAALKIKFDPPTVLRALADEAVLVIRGSTDDASEWSTGEARVISVDGGIGNYKVSPKMAAYPYAM